MISLVDTSVRGFHAMRGMGNLGKDCGPYPSQPTYQTCSPLDTNCIGTQRKVQIAWQDALAAHNLCMTGGYSPYANKPGYVTPAQEVAALPTLTFQSSIGPPVNSPITPQAQQYINQVQTLTQAVAQQQQQAQAAQVPPPTVSTTNTSAGATITPNNTPNAIVPSASSSVNPTITGSAQQNQNVPGTSASNPSATPVTTTTTSTANVNNTTRDAQGNITQTVPTYTSTYGPGVLPQQTSNPTIIDSQVPSIIPSSVGGLLDAIGHGVTTLTQGSVDVAGYNVAYWQIGLVALAGVWLMSNNKKGRR